MDRYQHKPSMALRESLVFPDAIIYGPRWVEGVTEYRLVKLTRDAYEKYKRYWLSNPESRSEARLLSEAEWRQIGLRMSSGWRHFLLWPKEPNVLCFRRPAQQP